MCYLTNIGGEPRRELLVPILIPVSSPLPLQKCRQKNDNCDDRKQDLYKLGGGGGVVFAREMFK